MKWFAKILKIAFFTYDISEVQKRNFDNHNILQKERKILRGDRRPREQKSEMEKEKKEDKDAQKGGLYCRNKYHTRVESEKTYNDLQNFLWNCYKDFTQQGSKRLNKGEDLNTKMQAGSGKNPFMDFINGGNMVKVVFVSYVWDCMLKAFFLNMKSGDGLNTILDHRLTNFVKEGLRTTDEVVEVPFGKVVKIHNEFPLRELEDFPCYEFPAPLRLIAPLNKRFTADTNFSDVKNWCLNVLKGLPLQTIMQPWGII